MNGLALCAGIGGLELGVGLAVPEFRTVCYVEGEAYAASILAARMAEGCLAQAPIWDDLRTFDGRPWRGVVDILTAGYPCQPFSLAGKRRGVDDERHLWPDIARVIEECEPELVFCENVSGHLSKGFDVVVKDMEDLGYRVAAGVFTAWAVGAPHVRERLFWLATNSDCSEVRLQRWGQGRACGAREGLPGCDGATRDASNSDGRRYGIRERGWKVAAKEPLAGVGRSADTDGQRQQQQEGLLCNERRRSEDSCWRPTQPPVCGADDAAPCRVDRLRALGNAVVPAVAARAFRELVNDLTLHMMGRL